jgi:hypothetical protein
MDADETSKTGKAREQHTHSCSAAEILRTESLRDGKMFEVTRYEPPYIYATSRRTGETYRFLVDTDGIFVWPHGFPPGRTAGEEEARSDQGDAHRAAIEYLARFAKPRAQVRR